MKNATKVKYLLIGNSAGGIGAAEAIREVDKTGTILIISDESYPVYSRPLIAKYLAEGYPLEKMLYRPTDFYPKNNIQTRLGNKVTHLDIANHTVRLEDGQEIQWQKLLLATGGSPIIPRVDGITKKGVFPFITLDDAKAIDQFVSNQTKAVIIGGGLIGTSLTAALVERGVEVTVVEMKEHILNAILDDEMSVIAEATLIQNGVKVITGHTVTKINSRSKGDDTVSQVTLNDGTRIPCDMVAMAIRVRPRSELVSGTGVTTNRGIVVDRYMTTSNPDVYASGDVAEAYDLVYQENRLTPIWPNAYLGGRIAGLNMAGRITEYPGGTSMNAMNYFGLNIVSAGILIPADDSYEVLSQRSGFNYV